MTRELGPEAVSLREVQRRAGVSPAAAYRHYRDRHALLVAVGRHASGLMADRIDQALAGVPEDFGTGRAAARLRRGSRAYLDFALAEPGLFRAVFLTDEAPADLQDPDPASRGFSGLGPFQLLQEVLKDLLDEGLLPARDLRWSDTAVWAAVHGLAVLLLDGPLRRLDPLEQEAAAERLLTVVVTGLLTRTTSPP